MAPPMGSVTSVTGLVVFGTITSLAAKTVYEIDGTGRDGLTKTFEKPWFMTALMFGGMSFCLPLAYYLENKDRKERAAEGGVSEPLLVQPGEVAPNAQPRDGLLANLPIAIPTFFDLIATILMNIGLLWVTASVYQMMRGAEMLFAALFSVVFLKRTLTRFHYYGILCCVTGIALVGYASTMSGEGSAHHVVSQRDIVFGMGLIVMSQAVQAAQLTFEDYFMSDMAVPPLKIVGFEGVFGFIAVGLIILPIIQFLPGSDGKGFHEDTIDSFYLLKSSPVLLAVVLTDIVALLGLNVSGMCVTGHFGAVFRTVLETTRTLAVWLVGLLLYYTPLGGGRLGESWNKYSWIQALGFVVLVTGTVVYGKGDEEAEAAEAEAEGLAPLDETLVPAGSATLPSLDMPIARRMITPTSVPISSSLKSTMNISAFGAHSLGRSYGSMGRAYSARQRTGTPSGV